MTFTIKPHHREQLAGLLQEVKADPVLASVYNQLQGMGLPTGGPGILAALGSFLEGLTTPRGPSAAPPSRGPRPGG